MPSILASELLAWIGGGTTTIIAVIGVVWRIRKEREDLDARAREVAIAESKAAVEVMGTAMAELRRSLDSESQRSAAQATQIADLSNRMTEIETKKSVAIGHIARREAWAQRRWKSRPKGLETVPVILVTDVMAVEPDLQLLNPSAENPPERNPPVLEENPDTE